MSRRVNTRAAVKGLLPAWNWLWSLRPPIVVNDLPILEDPGYAFHMMSRRMRKLSSIVGESSVSKRTPAHVMARTG